MKLKKMKFKDYEYGWYGSVGGYGGKWMDKPYICKRNTTSGPAHDRRPQTRSNYEGSVIEIKKQLPKLKGVKFIYGDYKTSV